MSADVTSTGKFVRLSYKSAPSGKPVTVWAEKLSARQFRKVNAEGEWGADSTEHRILLDPRDIIKETPAGYSRKYGTLRTAK